MSTPPADSWDSSRQAFAEQFEQDGTSFIYRRSQKGEAIRVSAEERAKFVDAFHSELRRLNWIIYAGLTILLGGMIFFSLLKDFDLSQPAFFAGIALVMIPYFAYYRWAWAAPTRELAGRTPIAGERSPEEVRHLRFRRITYGQLASAAVVGFVIPLAGSSRQDVLSGWNRLWLVFGGGLVLLAAVQAFRKWRFDQEDSYRNSIPRSFNLVDEEPVEGSAPRTKRQLWRYLPLAVILFGFAFIGFTPAGKRLAQAPSFLPIVMIGIGTWALFSVARGFSKGEIEPFVRGFYNTYERETQPKRFWASMGWNGILGCICLWGAFELSAENANEKVEKTCYNETGAYSPSEARSACEKLIERLTAAITKDPADAYAYFQRGYAYEQMEEMRPAIADFTQVIRLTPDDANAYFNRGYAYEHLGDLQHTVADFSKIIRLKPDEPDAYYYRWAAYKDLGDDEHAAADLAVLDRLNPKLAASLRRTPQGPR